MAFQCTQQGLAELPDVTLTVFMEGTGNPIASITTQIAMFSRLCVAEELPVDGRCRPSGAGHYKISFAGCGVSHGLKGTLFAVGLREQCKVVRTYLNAFLDQNMTVRINFVGLSRGGIGGMYLAQEFWDISPERVLLNLLLFDPVPGNFVWMARLLDCCRCMNANRAMDVSSCRILGRVVVLYPHEPLPDIAVHAPLIASFPRGCDVEQDVILGCHQGALFLRPSPDTRLAFARIRDFLVECGSRLEAGTGHIAKQLDMSAEALANLLDEQLNLDAETARISHSPGGAATIVRHSHGVYLNRTHEALRMRLGEPRRMQVPGVPYYMLDIV